jgi:copper transport protein
LNDKRRPYFVLLVAILLSGVIVGVVHAHANLIRSNPPANAVLDQSPDEIRLWFTEPLEPHFSTISLRDSEGAVVDTPRAEVDPDDDFQLFLLPGELTDGVYTVAWRVISSTDGHQTEGSFPFVIGDAVALAAQQTSIETPIPLDSAVIRWLNLFSMALAVGSVGFWLFVWNPSVSQTYPQIERRMRTLIWAGWAMLGATTVLILLLQTSIVADTSVIAALTDSALKTVITDTRFGEIWIIRVVLWLFLGVTVFAGRKNPSGSWPRFPEKGPWGWKSPTRLHGW